MTKNTSHGDHDAWQHLASASIPPLPGDFAVRVRQQIARRREAARSLDQARADGRLAGLLVCLVTVGAALGLGLAWTRITSQLPLAVPDAAFSLTSSAGFYAVLTLALVYVLDTLIDAVRYRLG